MTSLIKLVRPTTGYRMRITLFILMVSALAGCIAIPAQQTVAVESPEVISKPAAMNKTTRILPDMPALPEGPINENVKGAVASSVGAISNIVIEQLVPGWSIEQTRIGDKLFRIEVRRKRFTSGGDGEAAQVIYRHAEQITRRYGYSSYTVMEFTEGVDTMFLVSQRVAQSVIQVR